MPEPNLSIGYILKYNNCFKQCHGEWGPYGSFSKARLYDLNTAISIKKIYENQGKNITIHELHLYLGEALEGDTLYAR